MENLPSSRFHLVTLGINCLDSSSPYLMLWNYFIRFVSVTMLVSLLCVQLYGVVCFDDAIIIINTAHLSVNSSLLFSYVTISSKTTRLFQMLDAAMQRMDNIAVRKIRSFDNRNVSIKFGYMVSVIIALVVYFRVNGIKREASVIAIGFKSYDSDGSEFSSFFLKCIFVATVWTYWEFYVLMQFYVSIMYASVQVADQMRQQFMLQSTPDYEMMRRSLEWYNQWMKTVNEEIGVIPFSFLTIVFIGFACAISFLVTGSELGVSLWLTALTFGLCNLNCVKSFHQLVVLGSESRRSISNAWKIAEETVADTFSFTTDCTYSGLKTRKSLKFFLITESVVPAKAADSIIIDRSLILNFFNQLIPFTVMMFTTLKEFQKKPK